MDIPFYALVLMIYECVAMYLAALLATDNDYSNVTGVTVFKFLVCLFAENLLFLSILSL